MVQLFLQVFRAALRQFQFQSASSKACGSGKFQNRRSNVLAPNWYVLQTKRHEEERAKRCAEGRGVICYLPRILLSPRPAVGSAIAPMFPGYLFAHVQEPGDFARLQWTPGVKSFVSFCGIAASIDSSIIEALRSREGAEGVISNSRYLSDQAEQRVPDRPLRGLFPVVDCDVSAQGRVQILMKLLQRSVSAEMSETLVR
jgi:transcriptional antiterminator RfaH